MASWSRTRRANASASPVRQEATRSRSGSAPLSGLRLERHLSRAHVDPPVALEPLGHRDGLFGSCLPWYSCPGRAIPGGAPGGRRAWRRWRGRPAGPEPPGRTWWSSPPPTPATRPPRWRSRARNPRPARRLVSPATSARPAEAGQERDRPAQGTPQTQPGTADRRPPGGSRHLEIHVAGAPGHEAREHHQAGDSDEHASARRSRATPSRRRATPLIGPASTRGRVKRLESSAYCVAEKRFCVSRSSSTPKAPVPRPLEQVLECLAAYMTGRLTPTCATAA